MNHWIFALILASAFNPGAAASEGPIRVFEVPPPYLAKLDDAFEYLNCSRKLGDLSFRKLSVPWAPPHPRDFVYPAVPLGVEEPVLTKSENKPALFLTYPSTYRANEAAKFLEDVFTYLEKPLKIGNFNPWEHGVFKQITTFALHDFYMQNVHAQSDFSKVLSDEVLQTIRRGMRGEFDVSEGFTVIDIITVLGSRFPETHSKHLRDLYVKATERLAVPPYVHFTHGEIPSSGMIEGQLFSYVISISPDINLEIRFEADLVYGALDAYRGMTVKGGLEIKQSRVEFVFSVLRSPSDLDEEIIRRMAYWLKSACSHLENSRPKN